MTAPCSAQRPTSMKLMARLLRKYTWLSFLAVKGSWTTTTQVERSTHPTSTQTVAVCVPFPFVVQPVVLHRSWPESGRPASGTCAVHLHRGWAPMVLLGEGAWGHTAHALVERLTTSCQPFATCKHVTVGPQDLLVVVEEVNYPERGSNSAACTERSTALAAWRSGCGCTACTILLLFGVQLQQVVWSLLQEHVVVSFIGAVGIVVFSQTA